jgi:hypothetical protein
MELLTAIGIAFALLVIFDLVAVRFGVDSRDRIGDDRQFPMTPRWL